MSVDSGAESPPEERVQQYLPRLRAFVRARMSPAVRRRESCSDIVQSVCRELVENRSRLDFPDEARFRGWLFTAALTKV